LTERIRSRFESIKVLSKSKIKTRMQEKFGVVINDLF